MYHLLPLKHQKKVVKLKKAKEKKAVAKGAAAADFGTVTDPVKMYLREMGSVELLSREGEIAIAKRIEAGRNTMIAGLCESPLTFQAIGHITLLDALARSDLYREDQHSYVLYPDRELPRFLEKNIVPRVAVADVTATLPIELPAAATAS